MVGWKRIAPVGMTLVGLLAGVGCGDSTGPSDPFATYILRTIATLPLPFVIADFGNGQTEEVTGGSILLNSDQTFSQIIASRSSVGGGPTDETSSTGGTFTLEGESIALTYSTAQEGVQGTLSGDTLMLQIQQIPWVFVRSQR